MIGMCVGVSYITAQQPHEEYGCTSIVVQFGDEVWEDVIRCLKVENSTMTTAFFYPW